MTKLTKYSAGTRHAATELELYPPLALVTCPVLTTAEIAFYTKTQPQTWRAHACYESGPIKPLRLLGKLRWSTDAVRRLLGEKE